ncbi:muscarinic acetylcholine receptor M1-like [Diadema setosum]|uniref:muscarinic acetylcholine receptor M1-like n=1 Tax=Diadema setosum TaxID=31175 RepID=UPI003B3B7D6F
MAETLQNATIIGQAATLREFQSDGAMPTLSMSTTISQPTEDGTVVSLSDLVGVVGMGLVTVLTVIINILILLAFRHERRLRSYNNYYIMNMTVADLCVGLFNMPLRATFIVYGKWIFGKAMCHIFQGVQHSLVSVSVMGLVVICIDRYIATYYPIRHFQRRSKRVAIVANIFTWIVPFAIWMGFITVWDFVDPPVYAAEACHPNYTSYFESSIVSIFLTFVAPFFIILTLYLRIYRKIRKMGIKHVLEIVKEQSTDDYKSQMPGASSGRRLGKENPGFVRDRQGDDVFQRHSETTEEHERNDIALESTAGSTNGRVDAGVKEFGKTGGDTSNRESSSETRKATRTLTFIVVIFLLVWIPYDLVLIYFTVTTELFGRRILDFRVIETVRWMTYANSLLNPLAYAAAQPLFRKTIYRILLPSCR